MRFSQLNRFRAEKTRARQSVSVEALRLKLHYGFRPPKDMAKRVFNEVAIIVTAAEPYGCGFWYR